MKLNYVQFDLRMTAQKGLARGQHLQNCEFKIVLPLLDKLAKFKRCYTSKEKKNFLGWGTTLSSCQQNHANPHPLK